MAMREVDGKGLSETERIQNVHTHIYVCVCIICVCVYIYICTYPAAWGAQVQKTQTLIVIKARKYIVAESSSVYIIP